VKTTYHLGVMSYSSHDPSAAVVKLTQNGKKIQCSFFHFEEGIRIFMKSHKTEEKNQVIDLLADTYENRGDLLIESIFYG